MQVFCWKERRNQWSASCKKRFGKIMMEEMELVAQKSLPIYSMILKGKWSHRGSFSLFVIPDDLSSSVVLFPSQRLIRQPDLSPHLSGRRGGTAIFLTCLSVASSVSWPSRKWHDLLNLGQVSLNHRWQYRCSPFGPSGQTTP